jgi:phosphoribosylformylglycinamidine (FGAM) synthase-like enzyme
VGLRKGRPGYLRRLGVAGLCAAGLCSLPACGGSKQPDTAVQSLGAGTSAAGGSSSTAAAPADVATVAAQQDAKAAVLRYFSTIDTLYSNPMASYNTIYTISTGNQAGIDRASIGQDRVKGLHQVGRQRVVSITVGPVNLTNQPSHKPNPVFPTVQVNTCNDVSKVRSVDAKGVSHVAAGRKDFFLNTLTVTNIAYPASGSWRVSEITNKEASACS